MPDGCRDLIAKGKALGDVGLARQRVSGLYQADPEGRVVSREILGRIEIAAATVL